ncbi:MAG: hypothetical protein V4850_29210 [Myxococcota bacterium]
MTARSPLWLALFVLTGCGGAAGNCSVVQNDDGSATVECPDGTSATLTGGEAGTDGAAGTDGTNGTNGTDGTDGTAGTAALLRIDEEAPGESCANGGVAIHAGLDDDADGALSDLEIDSTAYLCNGTDGTDGSDGTDGTDGSDGTGALVRIEALAAGDECAEGGVVIYAGVDTDADAWLDESEVTDTAYLCGGELAVSTSTVEFPSSSSTIPRGSLGGSGTFYIAGDSVTQTFTGTGLTSVTELDLAFDMYDATSTSCSVGTLSWDVSVNDTTVGSYSIEGGLSLGDFAVEELYTFPAIAGTGVDGDSYELTIAATTTVCGGGGSWNWYPGGTAILGR